MIYRIAESTWFTWVSQSNHIVMDVHEDDDADTWLTTQVKSQKNFIIYIIKVYNYS